MTVQLRVGLAPRNPRRRCRAAAGGAPGGAASALHSRNSRSSVAHQAIAPQAVLRLAEWRQIAFSSQPASSASTSAEPLFLTVNCSTVAGSEESSVFSGMNGEKASRDTSSGEGGIFVFDIADRVFAGEGDVAPAGPVQRALLDVAPAPDPQRKALFQRRVRLHRLGVMRRPGADAGIEQVPMPELAVAAQIKLAGANAPHGHADLREVGAAIDLALSARGERLAPIPA